MGKGGVVCQSVYPLPCLLLHLWLSLYPTCTCCAHRFIKILNLEVECLNFKTYGVFHSAPFKPYTSVICSNSQTWATTISDNFRTYLASPEETSCLEVVPLISTSQPQVHFVSPQVVQTHCINGTHGVEPLVFSIIFSRLLRVFGVITCIRTKVLSVAE